MFAVLYKNKEMKNITSRSFSSSSQNSIWMCHLARQDWVFQHFNFVYFSCRSERSRPFCNQCQKQNKTKAYFGYDSILRLELLIASTNQYLVKLKITRTFNGAFIISFLISMFLFMYLVSLRLWKETCHGLSVNLRPRL